ncbi:hypothetical protein FHW23_003441 [Curtobacterium pusillum]|uniref:Transposase n=1 Tax=Curtobacterium pusillum TaxID=69373 RepID=A0AAW3TCN9_9MICO|nr:hypothetical protein [Curtobacterium pusillum]MBA8992153.1 hypothetical protein [Curtobacterium pusillum]
MTAALSKYHDAEHVDRWFEQSLEMPLGKWVELGRKSVKRAVREVSLVCRHGDVQAVIERAKAETRKSNAGQKAKFSEASALMLVFVSLRVNGKMSLMAAVEMLMRMNWKQRRRLGITEVVENRQELMYDRVWAALARLRDLVDDEPGDRHEGMLFGEYLQVVANRDPEEMAARTRRRTELMSAIVHGSVLLLPQEIRDRSEGVHAIDATIAELVGMHKTFKNMKPTDKMPTNHGGGLYVRHGDHDGSKEGPGKRKYGQEIEYCIWVRNDPDADKDFPLLFTAIGDHKPGKLAGHGQKMLESLIANGIKIKTLIADRAYTPNAKVEDLQLPYAQHGVKLIMDYGIDQKGKQAFWASPDGKHNLVMCDGSWYLSSMPEALQLAEKTYADAKKAASKIEDETVREERIAAAHALVVLQRARRSRFRLEPRGRHRADGARQYFYPALRPEDRVDIDPQTAELVEITVPSKTVLIPGVIGGSKRDGENVKHLKYGQEFEYKSERWRRMYGLRNTVESGNASVKNPEHLALGIAMKRLVRGPWFAALCAAMAAACENISRIVDWYQERLELAHRNRKNRSHPAVYKQRDSAKYWADRRASTAPPDIPAAA